MVHSVEDARWLAPAGVIAAVCLGWALQISNGFLHPTAIALVALSFVVFLAAAVIPRSGWLVRLDSRVVRTFALSGLLLHFWYLFTAPPGMYLHVEPDGQLYFAAGLVVIAAIGGAALWGPAGRLKAALVLVLVATHAALGAWVMRHSPDPAIDVHLFHRYAIDALRSGVNPYAITFPDIYKNADFYGPGLSVDGRLQFGFPYFPLSLIVAVPGQIVGQDPRFAQLAAMELAAVLMAFARRNGFGLMAAALFLSTPRIFFVLEQSWTEPFVVFGLSAVAFAACRMPAAVPWLFGAFVALKQYMVFALPAATLLVGSPIAWRRLLLLLAKAGLLGAAITLPFFFWNPAAFWKSVVTLQFHQPFRPDALSALAWWFSLGHAPPSSAVPFAVAALTSGLAIWRLPRTAAGFSAAIAITFFAFFAFNKQAFCNYYFFVVGALFVTVAVCQQGEPDR
jgi:hypothetical protein